MKAIKFDYAYTKPLKFKYQNGVYQNGDKEPT